MAFRFTFGRVVAFVTVLVGIGCILNSLLPRSTPPAVRPQPARAQKSEKQPEPEPTRTVLTNHPGNKLAEKVEVVAHDGSKWFEYFRADGTLRCKEYPQTNRGQYEEFYDETGKDRFRRVWKDVNGKVETVQEKRDDKEIVTRKYRTDGTLVMLREPVSDKVERTIRYKKDGKTVWWTKDQTERTGMCYTQTVKVFFDYSNNPCQWTIEREIDYPSSMSSRGPAKTFARDVIKRADGTILCQRVWYVSYNFVTRNFEHFCGEYLQYGGDGKTLVRKLIRDAQPTQTGIFPIVEDFSLSAHGTKVNRFYRDDETLEREVRHNADGRSRMRRFESQDNVRPEIPDLMYYRFGMPMMGEPNDI